jgi:hypothetical protein
MKRILFAIVIITMLCGVVEARRDGEKQGEVFDKQYNRTGSWRYDGNQKEVVLYDKQYNMKGYVNPKSGDIFDKQYNKTGNVKRGW